jgi:Type II CAAX prenyl endopeptidase Rce1-like
MKYFASLIREQLREDARRIEFWLTVIFLVTAAIVDHRVHWVRSLRIELSAHRNFGTWVLITAVMSAPFFVPLLFESIRTRDARWCGNRILWARFAVYAAAISIQNLDPKWINGRTPISLSGYGLVLARVSVLVLATLTASIFSYVCFDRAQSRLYGLRLPGFSGRPYALIALFATVVTAFGAHFSELARYYPVLPVAAIRSFSGSGPLFAGALFEMVYLCVFVGTEILYRGALTIGMSNVLGSRAILPMVCVYTFLHFPKPLAETLASIVGGYVLGTLALRTRNLLGGIALHVTVALTMELVTTFRI